MEKIWYGGDYNPEQWPKQIWNEDMKLFHEAGINILTLNVFSWAALQPSKEVYDFSKLDAIMELVQKEGFKVCLATSTGAHPAWMAKRYPDILRTEMNGTKRKFGGRHNSCPNSPAYQKYAPRLAKKLAERYQGYDNIVAWHISNEYGGECYCENCEKAFRGWLKNKYKTIDKLNQTWYTSFWGHTFYDWDEVVVPDLRSEHFDYNRTMFQGITLDYKRFNSESIRKCFQLEVDAIKAITPQIPVTTNLMGSYQPLDYKDWGKYMDFISWDNYPSNQDQPADMAFNHALMRGVGNQKSFWLMEQTPSVTNWQDYNALKRPGVMRLWSYQAVAHGADAVMFFQMRRSIGACEKLHGAVIDHVGTGNTRVFREIKGLGQELNHLEDRIIHAESAAKIALYFDWDNWWALDNSAGPSCLMKYKDEVLNYYRALHGLHMEVDIVGPEDMLDSYQLLVAPLLYMTKPGYDEKIRAFTKAGGTFVTTFFSGIADENDLIITGGYPGILRDILGIWVEESDALPQGKENAFIYQGQNYPATVLCDLSHLEGAESLADYEVDFYAGMPAITCNHFGKGRAYCVQTRSNDTFYRTFLLNVCKEVEISPVMESSDAMLEITRRIKGEKTFYFLLNHGETESGICLPCSMKSLLDKKQYNEDTTIEIPAKGVLILQEGQ